MLLYGRNQNNIVKNYPSIKNEIKKGLVKRLKDKPTKKDLKTK